jgi:hypothetical protein
MGEADQGAALEAQVASHFADSARLKQEAAQLLSAPIARAIGVMAASLKAGGKILSCGNGGSAADAQHFAAELVKPLRARARAASRSCAQHGYLDAHLYRQRLRLRAGDSRSSWRALGRKGRRAARDLDLGQFGERARGPCVRHGNSACGP